MSEAVPNLMARLQETPAVARAFFAMKEIFDQTSFDAREREIITTVVSVEHRCRYCVAFHSAHLANSDEDPVTIAALRGGGRLPDARLDALAGYVRALVRGRGTVGPGDLAALRSSGYTDAQAREAVIGVAFMTLSNYTNHLAPAALDE